MCEKQPENARCVTENASDLKRTVPSVSGGILPFPLNHYYSSYNCPAGPCRQRDQCPSAD